MVAFVYYCYFFLMCFCKRKPEEESAERVIGHWESGYVSFFKKRQNLEML